MTWRTPRNRFTKNLLRIQRPKLDASVWQTGQSGFLGTETMNSLKQVSDKFNTNLEVLKIAYKI
jgi:TATA-box binding protein (TBP) (component of TFIID and TFIIIB)